MDALRQDSLRLTDSKSDKEYHLYLLAADGGYIVKYRNGPYGNANAGGINSKTQPPVTLEQANKIYDAVYNEKFKKGYRPMDSAGSVLVTADDAKTRGKVELQLLKPISREEGQRYIASPRHFFQEKKNGHRRAIVVAGGEVYGINKLCNLAALPKNIVEAAGALGDGYIIDGELIGDRLFAFDLLQANGEDITGLPQHARFAKLVQALSTVTHSIEIIPGSSDPAEKARMVAEIEANGGEGYCVKDIDAPYDAGARTDSQLKVKFVESATVEVERLNDRNSFGMRVYDEQGPRSVGNCTLPRNAPKVNVGDICEVIYLPARTKRNGALAEPVFAALRDDATIDDCTYAQLKFEPSAA